jgi:solute carrier family 35 protein E1
MLGFHGTSIRPKSRLKRSSDYDPESGESVSSRAPPSSSKSWLDGTGFSTVSGVVIVWYVTAVCCITTSKMILLRVQLPSTLCIFQFVIAAVISRVYIRQNSPQSSVVVEGPRQKPHVWQIALSYALGFLFTNTAFGLAPVTFAETIKAGEPITSVLLGFIVLAERSSILSYLALVPICAGVAIASISDFSALSSDTSKLGLAAVCAMFSNFFFSMRAVLARRVFKLQSSSDLTKGGRDDDDKGHKQNNEVVLFYNISVIGLLLIVPLALYSEGPTIANVFNDYTEIHALQDPESRGNYPMLQLCFLVLVNGLAYACYNFMSFICLAKTDLVSHAVLNVFRRAVVIVVSVFIFDVRLTSQNVLGVSLAVVGVLIFSWART